MNRWWVISDCVLITALRKAQAGQDIESILAQIDSESGHMDYKNGRCVGTDYLRPVK